MNFCHAISQNPDVTFATYTPPGRSYINAPACFTASLAACITFPSTDWISTDASVRSDTLY
ncbi:hypothetical protein [Flavobacterium selenitireducens]|uniref:hypothetical protein n=1 Tax=Flavobacterium selenitireducens TaxID=2722704 RepID=UPI00168B11E4|nr:hypothetical protein [Flavobacterium selenitireducens]MBD3583483.1 hypothetical protein [Flavobacterium selenitireducens]